MDCGSYFEAFWDQIPFIVSSKIDAKITAEKVMEMMEIQCETDTEFDLKNHISLYFPKLNSSFLKALNVLKPLF